MSDLKLADEFMKMGIAALDEDGWTDDDVISHMLAATAAMMARQDENAFNVWMIQLRKRWAQLHQQLNPL